jgi:25S rRNA (cytosine2278-C5)-methyltransferase
MGKRKKHVGILGNKRRGPLQQNSKGVARQGQDEGYQRIARRNSEHLDKERKLQSPLQQQCAAIIAALLDGARRKRSKGSIKSLCLAPAVQNKRAVYAVVCETLKFEKVLGSILDRSGFLEPSSGLV